MVKKVKWGEDNVGQAGADALDRPLGTHGPPNPFTATPAQASSRLGHWTVPPDFAYRGHSKPGRNYVETDKKWEMLSAGFKYDNNSIAALMEFNLYILMKRLEGQLKGATKGSMSNSFRVKTGRVKNAVVISLYSDHPAFPYAMAGTAARREITWKKEQSQDDDDYPIIPVRGPWATNGSGYVTPEMRMAKIRQFRQLLEQAKEDQEEDDEFHMGDSEAMDWVNYALKFEGTWIDTVRAGGEIDMKHPTLDPHVTKAFKKKLPSFTNPEGKKVERKRRKKTGEIFVMYVLKHPGIHPNAALKKTMLDWGTPDKIRARTTPIASNLAQQIAAMFLSGDTRNLGTKVEGQTRVQSAGIKSAIQLKSGHMNINVFGRATESDGMKAINKALEAGNARRARWK